MAGVSTVGVAAHIMSVEATTTLVHCCLSVPTNSRVLRQRPPKTFASHPVHAA